MMGMFSDAAGLPVYREEDDEELFETSSSISGDSEDEDQFSDGEGDEALDNRFEAFQTQQPVRRLNSDSLYDLIKRICFLTGNCDVLCRKGLSKYYDGKSQSFACMSEVRCLEDLQKKEIPFRKIKPSKSYVKLDGGNQDRHVPGRDSRANGSSCANLMARNNSKNILYRPPPIPVNKSGCHQ